MKPSDSDSVGRNDFKRKNNIPRPRSADPGRFSKAVQPPRLRRYETPSFFCKLVDEVVYWNSSFFSG